MTSPVSWPVTLDIPVAWGDMDAFAHVNNMVYLRWFESARIAYFGLAGVLERMESDGIGPILARATVDFRKPVTFPDRILVSARVPELRNTSFTMVYRVTSHAGGDAVVAEGDSVVVMVNYRTGDKVPLSEATRSRVATLEASP
jgi:acyl-CoA thioester hydrolase